MWEQMDAALSRLPDLTNHVQSGRATGTDGKCDLPSAARSGARKVAEQCNTVQRGAVKPRCDGDDRDDDKPSETRKKKSQPRNRSGWGGIRTPGTLSRTAVFKTAGESTETQARQQVTDTQVASVARCVALLGNECPELVAVVQAWPDLPELVKAGILAMVRAVGADVDRTDK